MDIVCFPFINFIDWILFRFAFRHIFEIYWFFLLFCSTFLTIVSNLFKERRNFYFYSLRFHTFLCDLPIWLILYTVLLLLYHIDKYLLLFINLYFLIIELFFQILQFIFILLWCSMRWLYLDHNLLAALLLLFLKLVISFC